MSFDQGQFNFDAARDEDGYRHWREEMDEQKRAFETRWGIILGRRVSLKLMSRDLPLEGIINLMSDDGKNKGAPIRLSLKGFVFSPNEIESIMRIDEPGDTTAGRHSDSKAKSDDLTA